MKLYFCGMLRTKYNMNMSHKINNKSKHIASVEALVIDVLFIEELYILYKAQINNQF